MKIELFYKKITKKVLYKHINIGALGTRGHIASAINNEIVLKTEPTGSRLEYRVRAINKGGREFRN